MPTTKRTSRTGLTILDLLATTLVVSMLLAIVLPAITHARGRSRTATSMDNLRTLSAAHFVYSVDWNDRQLTFIVDDAATYGSYGSWYREYNEAHGSDGTWGHPANHPPIILGWTRPGGTGDPREYRYEVTQQANAGLVIPINWEAPGTSGVEYFGSFRFPNAQQFNQYLGGRFYDRVFYAPADEVVVDAVGEGFNIPDEYWDGALVSAPGSVPAWASYCMSPAAMFNPEVMRHDDPEDENANGWVEPFALDTRDAFASPSFAQFTYPALKTHMLEHHWLQNAPIDNCNPGFDPGTYAQGCEPYYFNMGLASVPMTLFYDGHVEGLSVQRAIADDASVRDVTGNENWGLWSKDTVWGEDGYFSEYGYDQAQTSFHILTTDGAEGRDVLAPGATSSHRRPLAPTDRLRRPKRAPNVRTSVDSQTPQMTGPDS